MSDDTDAELSSSDEYLHDNQTDRHANDIRIHGLNDIPSDDCLEQVLLLEEEDVEVKIHGYKYKRFNLMLYNIASVFSLGLVWLAFRWIPQWYVACIGTKVPLKDADWLVFEVNHQMYAKRENRLIHLVYRANTMK